MLFVLFSHSSHGTVLIKKCQYLGHPVLGSTLEHMQWEESKAGLKRNLRASPNEYGNSEERVNKTQVKKALSL